MFAVRWVIITGALVSCGAPARESASVGGGEDVTLTLPSTMADMGGTGEPTGGSATVGQTDAQPTDGATSDMASTSADTGDTVGDCSDTPPPPMGTVDPLCETGPKAGGFTPVEEWSKETWTVAPTYNQVMAAPIVVSLTDDDGNGKIDDQDTPDIVFTTFAGDAYTAAGWLRAVSGADGAEILNIGNAESVLGAGAVAGADIDGDGVVELLTIDTSGHILAYEHDGALKWTSAASVYVYVAPAVSDMDGDGSPEIVAGAVILNADGTTRGIGKAGTGITASFPADIDGDGVQEVVTGNALYRPDGSSIWENGLLDGFPAVADVDLDGEPEIAVSINGLLRLQRGVDGALVWEQAIPDGASGQATMADLDGDGAPEIGLAGHSVYMVFDGDGTLLWEQPIQGATYTSAVVFDFEGDGGADVVYNDELSLWAYSGTDGAVKLQLEGHGSGTMTEYPLAVDVDNDGQAEIVVVNNTYHAGTRVGVTVIGDMKESWMPARKIWNQHAYHITNVNNDGTVPAPAVQSWKANNSFRSGALLAADGAAAPDLVIKLAEGCEVLCVADKLVLWVYVGNEGASELVAGAKIDVIARTGGVDTLVETKIVPGPILPGQFLDPLVFEVLAADIDELRIVGTTDTQECKLSNNEAKRTSPFCGPPPR